MKLPALPLVCLALLAAGCARGGPVVAYPEAITFRVGAVQLTALRDARFSTPNDAHTFGLEVGPDAVAGVLNTAGAPTDHIVLSVDALLVRLPGRIVLIDTGLGAGAHGVLLASLAKAGVAPADITDVLITHSHGDHVGGLANAGVLVFPNATIRMSAREWTWMQTQGGGRLAGIVAGKVATFAPGAEVVAGITAVAIDGHTPGHVGYEIVSGRDHLLDIGDTAHSSIISLARPDWAMGFDNDKAQGRASRVATLTRLAKSHELIFAPHFPFPGVGRIEAAGAGFRWAPGLK
jgi:glyoxylase-like metal-dependent hydrolase (beta-lactamase superfamily II)